VGGGGRKGLRLKEAMIQRRNLMDQASVHPWIGAIRARLAAAAR
jgi:hypothetical protein